MYWHVVMQKSFLTKEVLQKRCSYKRGDLTKEVVLQKWWSSEEVVLQKWWSFKEVVVQKWWSSKKVVLQKRWSVNRGSF